MYTTLSNADSGLSEENLTKTAMIFLFSQIFTSLTSVRIMAAHFTNFV